MMDTHDNISRLRAEIKHGKFGPQTYSIDELVDVIAECTPDVKDCTDYPHHMGKYSDDWTRTLVEFYSYRISKLGECEKYGFNTGRYFHYDDPRNWERIASNRHNPENKINKVLDN